jgi:hypothetical protein
MKRLKILIFCFIIVCFWIPCSSSSETSISTTEYNFGEVQVGSTKTTIVKIENLDSNNNVKIDGYGFAQLTCIDFSALPQSSATTIPPNGSMEIEIGYAPTFAGDCSDTLNIFSGSPFPAYRIIFNGTGIEQLQSGHKYQLLLDRLQRIIDYTDGAVSKQTFGVDNQKVSQNSRIKAFRKMLIVAYQLIETSNLRAAHNKLAELYKKVDGKPKNNDFVAAEKALQLAPMIKGLIDLLDSELASKRNTIKG